MDDPAELALVYKALALARSESGYVTGYVEWCDDRAAAVARSNLSDHGLTPEDIRCSTIDFVAVGGKIDQVPETRSGYDYPYYYKVILEVTGVPRGVFVEMRLVDDDEADPAVHIVSAHRQGV